MNSSIELQTHLREITAQTRNDCHAREDETGIERVVLGDICSIVAAE